MCLCINHLHFKPYVQIIMSKYTANLLPFLFSQLSLTLRVERWLSPLSSPMLRSACVDLNISCSFSAKGVAQLVYLSKVLLWDDRVADGTGDSSDRCKLDTAFPVCREGRGGEDELLFLSCFLFRVKRRAPFTSLFSSLASIPSSRTGTHRGCLVCLSVGAWEGWLFTSTYCLYAIV